MLALVADLNPFAAGADEVFQGGVQIQRVAHLVKVGDLLVGALSHLAAVGLQFAQYEFEQGCFSGAIGSEQADLVPAHDGG